MMYPDTQIKEKQARPANNTLTMRDQFAMAALTGMLAYSGYEGAGNYHNNSDAFGAAQSAYNYADAMLAARGGK